MRKLISCLLVLIVISGCSQNEKGKNGLKSIDSVSDIVKKDEETTSDKTQEKNLKKKEEETEKQVESVEPAKESKTTETKQEIPSTKKETSSSQSNSQKQDNQVPSNNQSNENKNEKPITPTPQPEPTPTPTPPHTCSDVIPAGAYTDENEMDRIAQQKVLELLDTYGTAGYSVEYGETECGTRYCIPIYYYS